MRKALIILVVLLSVFLAIGCTGTKTNQSEAPGAVTPVVTETPTMAETPTVAETPTMTETPSETETPTMNETPTMTEQPNVTGNETQVKRVSRTAQKLAAIKAANANKESSGGAANVTPTGGY
jgi:PBP1b-binding outer membrane lipoprotein LpoB